MSDSGKLLYLRYQTHCSILSSTIECYFLIIIPYFECWLYNVYNEQCDHSSVLLRGAHLLFPSSEDFSSFSEINCSVNLVFSSVYIVSCLGFFLSLKTANRTPPATIKMMAIMIRKNQTLKSEQSNASPEEQVLHIAEQLLQLIPPLK